MDGFLSMENENDVSSKLNKLNLVVRFVISDTEFSEEPQQSFIFHSLNGIKNLFAIREKGAQAYDMHLADQQANTKKRLKTCAGGRKKVVVKRVRCLADKD